MNMIYKVVWSFARITIITQYYCQRSCATRWRIGSEVFFFLSINSVDLRINDVKDSNPSPLMLHQKVVIYFNFHLKCRYQVIVPMYKIYVYHDHTHITYHFHISIYPSIPSHPIHIHHPSSIHPSTSVNPAIHPSSIQHIQITYRICIWQIGFEDFNRPIPQGLEDYMSAPSSWWSVFF